MSAEIRPARPEDAPAVARLLHEYMNAKIPVERWLRLFTADWCVERPNYGLVVADGEEVVGYHGHICSTRRIRGRQERMLNFTSWYLKKEYRGQRLGSTLVRQAISDPEATCSVISLSPKRIDFYRNLGLKVLETKRYLWQKTAPDAELSVIVDPLQIAAAVDPEQARMIRDHEPYDVRPVLVRTCVEDLLLFVTVAGKRDNVEYHDVLYRSNAPMLAAYGQAIANVLLPADKKAVFAVDRRFVPYRPDNTAEEEIQSPRFYKSPRLGPEDIDLLYSELQLLQLKLD